MRALSRHDLQWCLRRCPKGLLSFMKEKGKDVMLAGGFIRACVANEHINDIDLFFPTKEAAKAASESLRNSTGDPFETENAITVRVGRMVVQCVHRWTFNDPAVMLLSFDFTIAQAGFWFEHGSETGGWVSMCHDDFYPDLAAKRLVYTRPIRNEDAGGSLLRVLKFYQRGYRIPLDSFGATIARCVKDVEWDDIKRSANPEQKLARVITGLLREVDPNLDPDHEAHLPSIEGDDSPEETEPEKRNGDSDPSN